MELLVSQELSQSSGPWSISVTVAPGPDLVPRPATAAVSTYNEDEACQGC